MGKPSPAPLGGGTKATVVSEASSTRCRLTSSPRPMAGPAATGAAGRSCAQVRLLAAEGRACASCSRLATRLRPQAWGSPGAGPAQARAFQTAPSPRATSLLLTEPQQLPLTRLAAATMGRPPRDGLGAPASGLAKPPLIFCVLLLDKGDEPGMVNTAWAAVPDRFGNAPLCLEAPPRAPPRLGTGRREGDALDLLTMPIN